MSAAPSAGLSPQDKSVGATRTPALLSASQIAPSKAGARPMWNTDEIDKADRRGKADKAVRQSADWM